MQRSLLGENGKEKGDTRFVLDYPDGELVFGLVCAVGTEYKPVLEYLLDAIRLSGYVAKDYHISDWFKEIAERAHLKLGFPDGTEYERIAGRIDAGNKIRESSERADIFALLAASKLFTTRDTDEQENPIIHKKTAHVLVSLKRPEEVETLRKIYGPGFFLIGIFADESERLSFLTSRKGLSHAQAQELIDRDQKEKNVPYGQRTRDTFQMSDVFVGPLLADSLVADVTEFGRAVHAEMDALMAAGRNGVSFRNATLYTTTFPCHTCTRHIIAAGVKRVVYIEPYPKSLAMELHKDAIRIGADGAKDDRIPFEPFLGIGPRRFFDLFSLKLSSGNAIERKNKGGPMAEWDFRSGRPRVPMPPTSYLEREQLISKTLNEIFPPIEELKDAERKGTSGQERLRVLEGSGEDGQTRRKLAGVEDRRAGNSPPSGEQASS